MGQRCGPAPRRPDAGGAIQSGHGPREALDVPLTGQASASPHQRQGLGGSAREARQADAAAGRREAGSAPALRRRSRGRPRARDQPPNFVARCEGPFFYTTDDEFAPFGSDAGSDTLHALQAWTARPRRGGGAAFLDALLANWGLTLPDLAEPRPEVVDAWFDDVAFSEVNQAVIATAFGQLKITGAVEPAIVALAVAANARERRAAEFARTANPGWAHADAKAQADERIRRALLAMA